MDPETESPLKGLYVAGWIKRGPTGVIGTNKPDAAETVTCMLEDLETGDLLSPSSPEPEAAASLVAKAQTDFISWPDWQHLQRREEEEGEGQGRPRVKFTSVEEMLTALSQA